MTEQTPPPVPAAGVPPYIILQSLLTSAEHDLYGHISLFRGAVYRGDQLGQEREQRLAQESLTRLCDSIRGVWHAQVTPPADAR